MTNQYDLKRYAILYVDDEEMALKYFVKTFGDEFRFMTALNAAEGLKLLETHGDEIGILITDQRMPGEKGVQLLERARHLCPKLVRMLVTAYSEFAVTVDAVNLGNIFRYISKPIDVDDVRNTLHRGMEYFMLQQERDGLLREKLSVLQNMLIIDRIMALAVVSAAQERQWRHSLKALKSYLNLAPKPSAPQSMELGWLRDPAFWRSFYDHVTQQCDLIAGLLGGLPPLNTGEETTLDAGAIFRFEFEANTAVYAQRGITATLVPGPALPAVQGRPTVFSLMIRMLINAHAGLLPPGTQAFVTVESGQHGGLHIKISDSGVGLPSTALRTVFDPYSIVQNPPDSGAMHLMGLCLMVCHHDGTIYCSDEVKGSGIVIDLPPGTVVASNPIAESRSFISDVLMNDKLWEHLLPES